MATTLRARLSLWNASAFAVLLGLFAAGTYAFVARTTQARTDVVLTQAVATVADALPEGLPDGAGAEPAAGVVRRFRYRDVGIAVFDATPALTVDAGGRVRAPVALAVTRDEAGSYPFGGPWGAAAAVPLVRRAVRAGTVVETLGEGPSAERVVATTRGLTGGRVLVVSASQSLGEQHEVLREAREALVAGVIFTLLVAGLGGWALTWWSLRPIAVMSRRAARIEAGTLHERLPVRGEVLEVARLANAFNGLLERVQRSFEQQRQFMADASHELRTPVAIVRGEAEFALAQPTRAEGEYRAAFATVRAQGEVLARLVDDLFLLARADAGEQALAAEPLYLEEVVAECVRAVRTLAAGRGVALAFAPDAELPVTGDARLLRRMVTNLLDNAIKYTPAGGRVTVTVARSARVARVEVQDTGPGIPEAARAHVFDRFFRARSVSAGAASSPGVGDASGAGLGLAIVAWVAAQHGGRALLHESGATGTTFALELPLSASP